METISDVRNNNETEDTMKFMLALILLAVLLVVIGGPTGGFSNGDCVMVWKGSVHAYYEPEFESALVGWFVQDEPLKYLRAEGDWWLVAGNGIDALGHQTRMSGWVQGLYMVGCF